MHANGQLLSRLGLLSLALTASLATAVPSESETAPGAGASGPRLMEVRRHAHGPWTVSQIVESEGPFVDPKAFFAGYAIEEIRQACPPGRAGRIAADGMLVFATQLFLLQKPGVTVLIDAGTGNDKERPAEPWIHRQKLPLIETLASLGVQAEDVDRVVLTHLHPDHVGFATSLSGGQWVPTFPKARYTVSQLDWDHFTRLPKAQRHPSVDDSVLPLAEAGVLDLVRPGEERAGLRLHVAPAHTPGSLLVELEGENVWFVGDLLHHPAQLARPEWKSADYDVDPGLVGSERRKYFAHLASTNAVFYATHLGHPYRVVPTGRSAFTGRIWPESE